MEKIYMEENNNRRRGLGRLRFSVVLSFVVAFFAIFSLATYGVVSNQGMNAISYAAPLGSAIDGDSFTFTFIKKEGRTVRLRGSGSGGSFDVPIFLANNSLDNPVFCVEHNVDPPADGDTVSRGDFIDDYGLLYILNNSYTNGKPRTDLDDGDAKKFVEEWITQVSIWIYLQDTQPELTKSGVKGIDPESTTNVKVNYISDSDRAAIESTTNIVATDLVTEEAIYPPTGVTAKNLYTEYVKPLVDEAKAASARKLIAVQRVSGEVSKTSDGKYYQSPKYAVIGYPSSDLNSFDVTLSGIDGAFIVDEDGKTLKAKDIPAGKAFYVRIPADKVTTKTQKLYVDVEGNFSTLTGNYFLAAEGGNALQKVITVTGTTRVEKAGDTLEVVGTPDTGMNTAQTIYFIGLIVLLCGVGIVYANAKPVEIKQQ